MIKAEGQAGPVDNWIKPEPGLADEASVSLAEEDIYEDAGDLDFNNASRPLYLTRLPKFLWDRWNALEENGEIQIGTIRIEGSAQDPERFSLMLSQDVKGNRGLPKEYNLQVINPSAANTFVFTEKDLPGYSQRGQESFTQERNENANGIARANIRGGFQDRARDQLQHSGKSKRWQPYQRRTIPKQTAIAGHVGKDINCLPVENAEYQRYSAEKNRSLLQPGRGATIVSDLQGATGNLLAPGTSAVLNNFTNLIKATGSVRGKAQDVKAARMPQNDLLDLIYECFREYRYWPMKSLKARLNQPEAYLRSTLELIAVLVKQGPHSGTWQLRPDSQYSAYESAQLDGASKDEAAPEFGDGGDSDTKDLDEFDDDEENIKMVDALDAT